MRVLFILTSLAATSLVSASTILGRQTTSFPDCAVPCMTSTDNLGGCSPTDNKCLCKNTAYIASTAVCITQKCSTTSEITQAQVAALTMCKAAGVDLLTMTAAVASVTASVASAASTATAAAGSSITSVASSVSALASSASVSTSAASASATTAAASSAGTLTAGKGAVIGGLAVVAAFVL